MPDESMRFTLDGDVAARLLRGIDELDKNVDGLTRRLDSLDKEQKQAGKGAAASVLQWQSLGQGLEQVSRQAEAAGRGMMNAGQRILRGMAQIAGAGVQKFAEFDQAIQNSVTVTGLAGDAFDDATEQLSEFALTVSRMSAKTPAEIGNAFYALGSAGFTVEQQMEATTGVVALAEATMAEVPFTAELVTSSMKAFGLEAVDTNRIVNALAAGISSSRLTMERLGYALPYVAATAKGFGVSLEETTATLGTLVDRGLEASMAGTGLRQVFAQLAKVTGPMEDLLRKYGLSTEDVSLKSHHLFDVLQTLQDAMSDVSAAERMEDVMTAFGVRAGTTAAILIEQGAPALRSFTAEITDTNRAMEMQERQLDTLGGQWTILGSTVGETGIRLTKDAAEPLKEFVELLQETLVALLDAGDVAAIGRGMAAGVTAVLKPLGTMVNLLAGVTRWFADLPPGVQGAVVSLTAFSGVALVAGGALLMLGGRLAGLLAPLAMLKAAGGLPALTGSFQAILRLAPVLLRSLGLIGLALGALYVAYRNNWFGMRDWIDKITDAIHILGVLGRGQEDVEESLQRMGMRQRDAQRAAAELTKRWEALRGIGHQLWVAVSNLLQAIFGEDLAGGFNDVGAAVDIATKAMDAMLWITKRLKDTLDGLTYVINSVRRAWRSLRGEGIGGIGAPVAQLTPWAEARAMAGRAVARGAIPPGEADRMAEGIMRDLGQALPPAAKKHLAPAADEAAGEISKRFKSKSPPELGPLSTIDRDGEELMRTLAQGIERGVPLVRAAGEKAAEALRDAIGGVEDFIRVEMARLDILESRRALGEVTGADVSRHRRSAIAALGRGIGRVGDVDPQAAASMYRQVLRLMEDERLMYGRPVELGPPPRQVSAGPVAFDVLRPGEGPLPRWVDQMLSRMGEEFSDATATIWRELGIGEYSIQQALQEQRRREVETAGGLPQIERAMTEKLLPAFEKFEEDSSDWLRAQEDLRERAQRLGQAMWYAAESADSLGGAFGAAIESVGRQFAVDLAGRLTEPLFVPMQKALDRFMERQFPAGSKVGVYGAVGAMAGTAIGGGGRGAGTGAAIGTLAGSFLGPVGAAAGGILGGIVGGLFGGGGRNPQIDRTNELLRDINASLRPQSDFFRTIGNEALFGPEERFYGGRGGPEGGSADEYVVTAARGSRGV